MIPWPIKVFVLASILLCANLVLSLVLSDYCEFAANVCWWVALTIGFGMFVALAIAMLLA